VASSGVGTAVTWPAGPGAVRAAQPSAAQATAVRNFLTGGITTGSTARYLTLVNFQPLPPRALAAARALIASIR
jgi:hypothetical protein